MGFQIIFQLNRKYFDEYQKSLSEENNDTNNRRICMSEMLEKARKYEDEQGKQIKAEDRPAFHVSPYVGWMNDPNGFSYYQGEYHLFYQYNPYDTHWDSMHWGHVVSKDLLHWEYLPAALAPDEDYDKMGCFSGSAIELDDGRQLLMYTAVDQETLEDGSKGIFRHRQWLLEMEKIIRKYEKNPVLDSKRSSGRCK